MSFRKKGFDEAEEITNNNMGARKLESFPWLGGGADAPLANYRAELKFQFVFCAMDP